MELEPLEGVTHAGASRFGGSMRAETKATGIKNQKWERKTKRVQKGGKCGFVGPGNQDAVPVFTASSPRQGIKRRRCSFLGAST